MKPRLLVSACLLGVNCRYDGGGKAIPELAELMELAELIPVCPEILGGLPTPRTPSERRDGRVVARDGRDVTDAFRRGAGEALKLAELFGAKCAILKERSPSCGSGEIYDGSFSGGRIAGDGVAAEILKENGVEIYGESRVCELMDKLRGGKEG